MKLTTRNTLVSLLLLTSPLSVAQANTVFDCFYAGMSAGQSLTTTDINFNNGATVNIPAVFNASAGATLFQTFKKNSAVGTLFAGYGISSDPLYLGAELSFKGNQAKASATNTTGFSVTGVTGGPSLNIVSTTNVRLRSTEFALDLRPGIVFACNSLLYARLGVARNKLIFNTNQELTLASTGFLPLAPTTFPTPVNASKNVTGLRLGAGLEQKIFECLSLRLDYVYTHYKKMQFNNVESIGGASRFNSTTVKTANHSFLLGLSYYW